MEEVKIRGMYAVTDCENEGDINAAENEVRKAGGIVERVVSWNKDSDEYIDDYYESKQWAILFYCCGEQNFKQTCEKLGIFIWNRL